MGMNVDSPWDEASWVWQPGNLVAVEPMIAVGTGKTTQLKDAYNPRLLDWPVYSDDRSLTVHYEHDVLVTPEGPRVLTAGLEQIDDVIRA